MRTRGPPSRREIPIGQRRVLKRYYLRATEVDGGGQRRQGVIQVTGDGGIETSDTEVYR